MKIVFFSTTNRSLPLLEEISKYSDVVLCVTKEDKRVGRKQEIRHNLIKKWSDKHSVECIQLKEMGTNELKDIMTKVEDIRPDLGIVFDFGYIIPEELINVFNDKLINIHFSLLPKYRGASPIQFAILNGDTKTGITYQLVDKYVDKGGILRQVEYNITPKENAQGLYEKLLNLTIEDMSKFLDSFDCGKLSPTPQDENIASYTYSKSNPDATQVFKEDSYVNITEGVNTIERMVRAYYPKPIVWTYVKDMESNLNLRFKKNVNRDLKVKIYETRVEKNELKIERIQMEGKNIVDWKDFKNGYLDSSVGLE